MAAYHINSVDEQSRPATVGSVAHKAHGIQIPFAAVVAASAAVLVLLLFWPTTVSMVHTWATDRNFSHGFLIPPVFLYLVWIRADRLAGLNFRPQFWGLPVLLALGLTWLLGNVGEIRVVQQFALVAMLTTIVWMVMGNQAVRALRFPLAFLFFMVPAGDGIIGALQDFTAWFAVNGLRLSKIPAILENRTITVPGAVWTVAEACSGTRYLLSSLVVGTVYASLVYRSWKRRLLFVLASIAVPIVANGLRAYGIIVIGYLSNNRLAAGVDHIIYGFVFFTAMQFVLFVAGLRWRESPSAQAQSGGVARSALESPMADKRSGAVLLAAVCAVLAVAWLPMFAARLWSRPAEKHAGELVLSLSPPWQATAAYDRSWIPDLHPDDETRQVYVSQSGRVDVYLARYSGTRGPELVSGYNLVREPHVWFGGSAAHRSASLSGRNVGFEERSLQSMTDSRITWICYWVGGEYTSSPEGVKYLQAKTRLSGKASDSAVLVFSTEYPSGAPQPQNLLRDFLAHTSVTALPVQWPPSQDPASRPAVH
jgi:exosortase A